ncbi:hypothetical protein ABIE52_000244 [Rhodococcus sp. OAS809]|jgi:hypothetical protein
MTVSTSSNSRPTVRSGSMSTTEIKSRIEAMYADRGPIAPKKARGKA